MGTTSANQQPMPGTNEQPSHARYLVVGLIASGAVSLYITRHVLAVTNEEIQQELTLNPIQMINKLNYHRYFLL